VSRPRSSGFAHSRRPFRPPQLRWKSAVCNARVAALQKRWDRQRARLDLILDQRGADMADIPGGTSGLPVRDYKGKEADRLVTRIDPGVVSLVAELRAHQRQAAEELERWKTGVEEPKPEWLPRTWPIVPTANGWMSAFASDATHRIVDVSG
jgi:hypothetical protein